MLLTSLVLFLLIIPVTIAAGRSLASWSRLPECATALERNLAGLALGLGLLAYLMLALGLAGGLFRAAAAAVLVGLAVLGAPQARPMAREWAAFWAARRRPRAVDLLPTVLFAAFALASLVGVGTPPTLTEWDSIAYHLADPKLYIQAHRIYYLPWESHSNFAFTAEMWYTLGLLLTGVPLAKLFHFACAVGTALALYAFAARHLTPRIGLWAALLFASTPLVFWEAGTAYVDLATTFYAMVTLLVVANGIADRDERWLRLGAVLMGLTLSTKATSLTMLGLLAIGLLYWRLRLLGQGWVRALGPLAVWCLLALMVGSPWYIKSLAYTGNPVYPFYYHIFGGRYWNAADAAAYDSSNASFGAGHRAVDALLVPWNLTMSPLPGHPISGNRQSFYDYQTVLVALSPVLLAALFFPAFSRGAPGVVKALGLYALATMALWFVTMQYVRYLLPLLPIFCLLAVWVLERALAGRWLSGCALAALTGLSLAFSAFVGGLLIRQQAPVALGQVPRDAYIARGFPAYPAMQFINTQLPARARLVFYGSPLGFYCDRAYLWGEQGHSTFIPYDQFHSAADLRRFLQQIGVTHLLIDAHSFPRAPGYPDWVYQLTVDAGQPVYLDAKHGIGIWALAPAK